MDERVEFIGEWLAGLSSVVDLADRYGISRKTAYKWIGRYREAGPAGLRERSCAPLEHGGATAPELVEAILQQKEARPCWGPLKIVAKLSQLRPGEAWPAPSTVGEILKRAGLVRPRRRRHRAPPTLGGLTLAERANHVWAVDHKGWIRLGDSGRCEPLTVSDSYSRFLIALAACEGTGGAQARPVFERAFEDYGLPETIRSDNGSPFASAGVTGLTALGVWWAKLGIRHERIAPGRPQQNGRHERFHLTLKEAMEPPPPDRAAQAARFEAFRSDYNEERPHQALGQTAPARHYQASPRPMPTKLPEPDYPAHADIRRVRSNGEIKWAGGTLYVSEALIGELIAIEETQDGELQMRFHAKPLAIIDTSQKRLRRLGVPARGHAQPSKVSPDYPV